MSLPFVDSDQDSILQTRTQPSKNSNDLKRAAVDKLHFQHSTCQLDNCGIEYLGDIHPNGIIPTKYQVLCGRAPSDSSVAAAVRVVDHQRHCLILQHCQQQQLEQPQETVDEEGFQCKFNMMNGNLHLVKSSSSSDARSVAMETFDSNAPCVVTSPAQQQVLGGQQQQANHVHNHLLGKMTTADKKNNLNEQQQMLEQLNGMSINERRFGFGTNGTKNGTMVLTPRITLTSADDMDDVHHCDDMMMDYELNDSGPLSPNFLAVPKLQEVGKERRPPVMVKSV